MIGRRMPPRFQIQESDRLRLSTINDTFVTLHSVEGPEERCPKCESHTGLVSYDIYALR
jgi:hypothetical protein